MCAEAVAAVFTAEEFLAATGGKWLEDRAFEGSLACYTDTRQPGHGRIFLALSGEKFDGHDFLAQAVDAGAEALCISEKNGGKLPADCRVPVLLVEDTLAAYQNIARFHRMRFPELKVVAVTGSVGKTSVKEMCRAVLAEELGEDAVLYTIGNTNNQIGVPQNLLRLNASHRAAVIEMGTNSPGEIAPLSRCAVPSAALINSIAPCHLEKLGSFYGIAREKSAIFSGMVPEGRAVIPAECPAAEVLAEEAAKFVCTTFGDISSQAAVRSEFLQGDLEGSSFALLFPDGTRQEVRWDLTGAHQALNAAAAASVAQIFGILPEKVASGLTKVKLPGMRMAKSVIRDASWVNDAYNANPASMFAAFRQLVQGGINPENLVLVLGDMLELGTFEASEHKKVLQEACTALAGARIVTVGPRFARAASTLNLPEVTLCGSSAGAARVLDKLVKPGDTVFLKGSRGIGLEKAIPESDGK
ncbi:MAG: UDP-N-acetylmuramoyl-tripeptide--D-alanyl-D-alanine ligase [Lentisphaeria bacterium]|nr:UDP-N-acetylmuramoyl-tripeptide--D-alanyl-D-alanine ligase [Lentisphaeria bacterium]